MGNMWYREIRESVTVATAAASGRLARVRA